MADEEKKKPEESEAVTGLFEKFGGMFAWGIPILVLAPLLFGLLTGNSSINWDVFKEGGTAIIWRLMPVILTMAFAAYGQTELVRAGGKPVGGLGKILASTALINAAAGIFIEGASVWWTSFGLIAVMVILARVIIWWKEKQKHAYTEEGELREEGEKAILDLAEEHKGDIRKGCKDIEKALKRIEKEKEDLKSALTGVVAKTEKLLATGTPAPPGQMGGTPVIVSAGEKGGEISYTGQKPWKPVTEKRSVVYQDPVDTTGEIIEILETIKEKDKEAEKTEKEEIILDRGAEILSDYTNLVEKISDLYLQGCVLVWEKYWVRVSKDKQKLQDPTDTTGTKKKDYIVFERYRKNKTARDGIKKIIGHCEDALKGIEKMVIGVGAKDADGTIRPIGAIAVEKMKLTDPKIITKEEIDKGMGEYKTDGVVMSKEIVGPSLKESLANVIKHIIKEYVSEIKKKDIQWAKYYNKNPPYGHPWELKNTATDPHTVRDRNSIPSDQYYAA